MALNNFFILVPPLKKYQWRGTQNKKSFKQRYRVSCSGKTDCKALENGQRNELLRSSLAG